MVVTSDRASAAAGVWRGRVVAPMVALGVAGAAETALVERRGA